MKRFKIEQSNAEIISHSGLLTAELDVSAPLRHGIKHSDIIKSYLALLSTGKNDFEAINSIESEFYFTNAMDINDIPCEAALRQRMDKHATTFLPVIETGHVPIDADVTPMDNSGTHKEGVSRTYKGHDGFAPMAAYLGQEGYCIGFELREGKQHCQKITQKPLLLRLDGGNDSIENIDVILEHNLVNEKLTPVDFLIKWNPRKQDKEEWLKVAQQKGQWEYPREGKRIAYFSLQTKREWQGYEYSVRQVIRLVERTIDKHGQTLLIPEIKLEGWWTSLQDEEKEIIQLYGDHGTSEQFHSEFKTDMDICPGIR